MAPTRAAEADRRLIADELATTFDEDGWPLDQTHPALAATRGRTLDAADCSGRSCGRLRRCRRQRDGSAFAAANGAASVGGGSCVREIGCQRSHIKYWVPRRAQTGFRDSTRECPGREEPGGALEEGSGVKMEITFQSRAPLDARAPRQNVDPGVKSACLQTRSALERIARHYPERPRRLFLDFGTLSIRIRRDQRKI